MLHFCTGADEQKGVNLAANPNCALTTGNNAWKVGLDVVVEGEAGRVSDEAKLHLVADAYASKYEWPLTVRDGTFFAEYGAPRPARLRTTPTR